MCGGIKSQNIVDAIQKMFVNSGVDFVVEPYIDNVIEMYQRGDYFDRALITEQSWTHDGEDTDASVGRTRLNQFALEIEHRGDDTSFVFLTREEYTASMVYEEAFSIQEQSLIVVKQPTYTVNFFSFLISADFDKFPEDIVYKPQLTGNGQDGITDNLLGGEFESGDPEEFNKFENNEDNNANRLPLNETDPDEFNSAGNFNEDSNNNGFDNPFDSQDFGDEPSNNGDNIENTDNNFGNELDGLFDDGDEIFGDNNTNSGDFGDDQGLDIGGF